MFRVELEAWIRSLGFYSSAGSELRVYAWSMHSGFLGLGGPGWAEFALPPQGPIAIHNTFTGIVSASGTRIGSKVQNCGQGQGFTLAVQGPTSGAVRLQCFLWSAGASVNINLDTGSLSPGAPPPQLQVGSVGSTGSVTINGESVSVGLAKAQ